MLRLDFIGGPEESPLCALHITGTSNNERILVLKLLVLDIRLAMISFVAAQVSAAAA